MVMTAKSIESPRSHATGYELIEMATFMPVTCAARETN